MRTLHPARRFAPSTFSAYESAAPAVRVTLGLSRLSPALATEVRAAVARHADRATRRTADPLTTLMGRLRERVRSETATAVGSILDQLYRHASSSWAGGRTRNLITIGPESRAEGRTSRSWSANGKWSGTDLDRCVTVMPAWRRRVLARGLADLDGLLTTHAELIRATGAVEVYQAGWVRQGRGYDLHAETGVLAVHRNADGRIDCAYHATGDTEPDRAARGLARKLKALAVPTAERVAATAERTRRCQERQAAQLTRWVERLARWDLDEVAEVEVTLTDSYRAGNCEPGTLQFRDRLFPGRESATIGEIAVRVGRLDLTALSGADLTLARQVGAACMVAIRRARRLARA
jgi:hypothetical protein